MKKLLRLGACLALALTGARLSAAEPEGDWKPAAAAVEKATRDVKSLTAEYTRTYLVPGRSVRLKEEGTFSWKKTPAGAFARWEGKDENGPLLTLVRGQEMTVWRSAGPDAPVPFGKKEREASFDDLTVRHASKYGFPLIPDNWAATYQLGGPTTTPEYDSRFSKKHANGMPFALTFSPQEKNKSALKMVSFVFDETTGLAYKFRCDTYSWELFWVELGEWKINPALPDSLFDRPDRAKPAEAAPEKGKEPGKDGGKPTK